MFPGKGSIGQPNGISRVIENYYKYSHLINVEFVDTDNNADLRVAHAGMKDGDCDVSILHGIYFTGDYRSPKYEHKVNRQIAESIHSAYSVTVPTSWVAEIIQRDTHINPFVVPHGIDAELWKHDYQFEPYFLYNKNRDGSDVCDSTALDKLAGMSPDVKFVSTFSRANHPNIRVTGVMSPDDMKPYIQRAGGYLSLTKETFGIGVLEALASGVPVLGWRHGGNVDLIKHGVNGYLAEPGNYDDLIAGMRYIIKYRKVLSYNASISAREWTWENALNKLRVALDDAYSKKHEPATVSVIVPAYNYGDKIGRCLDSIDEQSFRPSEVIVVDDGSEKDQAKTTKKVSKDHGAYYYFKNNGGVATARNYGGIVSQSKYLCFIDADDEMDSEFLNVCVQALENDKSLYVAYTGLKAIHPDGREQVSQWPGEWNFDAQLKRKNQIPTCCVMRREAFERTGGYRQRYAPHGAGSEDADLWTRIGALGMKAKQVTTDPLFRYHVGEGHTSQSGYREVDWLGWNGYLKSGLHPFASYATPNNKFAHLVFQYDEPMVSVIIPVGPGHENVIVNALDSIEGQTYKKWEVIVVSDTVNNIDLSPWPFARIFHTDKPKSGPGVARNIGVKNARGKFVVFLDADDWLAIDALEKMLVHYTLNSGIVYSNYFGISSAEPDDLKKYKTKIVAYDEKKKMALAKHEASEYDCKRAQMQPRDPLYHWCLVTCLIPKVWHDEIGGFDENMSSWEDVDYHWRMARMGKCYSRIEDTLVYYNFNTGYRRNLASPEQNLDHAKSLIAYMADKYKKGDEPMACRTCGKTNPASGVAPSSVTAMSAMAAKNEDNSYVMIVYNHPNRGTHRVIGPSTGTDYGYRAGGEHFLVHVNDVQLMPALFVKQAIKVVNASIPVEQEAPKKLEAPKMIDGTPVISKDKPFDVGVIAGITPAIAKKLIDAGVDSRDKFLSLTNDYLVDIDGISNTRAKIIMGVIDKMRQEDASDS